MFSVADLGIDSVTREKPDDVARYFDRLWPLMRSLTGDGVRKTHDILSELVPLKRFEISSGTQVFDWVVPKEWVVREAYVTTPRGKKILDIRDHTLHLLNYSVPFRGKVGKKELDEHLYSLPDMPDAIPYVTSYYAPRWGFCLPQRMRDALEEGEYEVVIDTDHIDGAMTLSEAVLPGEEKEEVLISTYTCHPSLGNNELSGPLVAAFLYRRLSQLPRRRLTYRFVFLPETIGSIAYLKYNGEHLKRNLLAGYVATTVGDGAPFTYKRSRKGDTPADRAAIYVLSLFCGDQLRILDYFPMGSDERQYCSPGFDLPVGVIARSIYGSYKEYHTSQDNRNFISFPAMVESVDAYFAVCSVLDKNVRYRNLMPWGEPQLGKRGLYPTVGARKEIEKRTSATMWFLNFSDGEHDLLSISERSKTDFWLLFQVAQDCLKAGLVERAKGSLRCPSPERPSVSSPNV